MDSLTMLGRVVTETQRVVDNVTPDQLSAPSPCTEWTVRDVINHITAGSTMFSMSAEFGSVPDAEVARLMGGDILGDDYKGAFRAASDHAMEVFHQPGVLDKVVTLPFGELPARVALDIAVMDVAVHALDIATATDQTVDDDELLEAALAKGHETIGPDFRRPGIFDDEQEAPPGASTADRLLAFAGRKV
jgi:uncharacterized protein (TIGR03086 family)